MKLIKSLLSSLIVSVSLAIPIHAAIGTGGIGGGSSSGASTLAVGTGTAANFTNNITSPTAAISFLGSQFRSIAGGTTNFISLNQSSVTVQGVFSAGTNVTFTPTAGGITISATGGGGGGGSPLAVGTGTATNFTNNITSPTAVISFNGAQFIDTTNGTTNFVNLKVPGSTSQVIYNSGGNLAADSGLTYAPGLPNILTLNNPIFTLNGSGGFGTPLILFNINGNTGVQQFYQDGSGFNINVTTFVVANSIAPLARFSIASNSQSIRINENFNGFEVANSSIAFYVGNATFGNAANPRLDWTVANQLRLTNATLSVSTISIQGPVIDGNATAGTSGQVYTSRGTGLSPTWQAGGSGSGGSTIYNATSTAGFPFGFFASTGVFTSTITSNQIILSTVIAANYDLTQRLVFDQSTNSFYIQLGGLSNVPATFTPTFTEFDKPVTIGSPTSTTLVTSDSSSDVLALASNNNAALSNYITTRASLFSTQVGKPNINSAYWGLRSKAGEDAFFIIAGEAGTSGAESKFSTDVVHINVSTNSASYGNVGIGISTPTATLNTNGSVLLSTTSNSQIFRINNATASAVVTVNTTPAGLGSIFQVLDSTGLILVSIDGAGHVVYAGPPPIISGCGAGPVLATNASDASGHITPGTAATGCTITFANPSASGNVPSCNVTERTGSLSFAFTYTVSSTAITVSQTGIQGDIVDWNCGFH